MKRGASNSRQFRGSAQNSKLANRYNALLEDYLELQKECVSKKKKLQVENQKRDILRDEVWFLRKRHIYLTKSKFAKVEPELGPRQNVDIRDVPIRMERNDDVENETNPKRKVNRKGELVKKALGIKKQPKNCSLNKKKIGKEKKMSSPDLAKETKRKVALRV